LREFVLNYRHPDPRRMWTGGAERQSMDRIRWIRWNPGMGSFLRALGMKNNENEKPHHRIHRIQPEANHPPEAKAPAREVHRNPPTRGQPPTRSKSNRPGGPPKPARPSPQVPANGMCPKVACIPETGATIRRQGALRSHA
jgi:hypothetical protein